MSALEQLENSLNNVFGKNAPKLPEGGKKFLVQVLPWVNAILGIFSLWAAWLLWTWAHTINSLLNGGNNIPVYVNGVSAVATTNRLTMGIWLGIIVLVIEGVLYLAAYPGAKAHKKVGWNYMFYALLVNAVYGLIIVFTSYGTFGNLLSYIIGSVVGLYFLFQIRDRYKGGATTTTKTSS